MNRLKKTIETKSLEMPFQWSMFVSSLFAALCFCVIGTVLIMYVEKLSLMGLVLIVLAYLVPSLVGFDLVSGYSNTYNIPKLKHPRRFLILFINLILGLTVVGWLISLYLACKPGKVIATVETFETVSNDGGNR